MSAPVSNEPSPWTLFPDADQYFPNTFDAWGIDFRHASSAEISIYLASFFPGLSAGTAGLKFLIFLASLNSTDKQARAFQSMTFLRLSLEALNLQGGLVGVDLGFALARMHFERKQEYHTELGKRNIRVHRFRHHFIKSS